MKLTKSRIYLAMETLTDSGEYLNRQQVAARLGIHKEKVNLVLQPDKVLRCGGQKVYLYKTESVDGICG